MQKQHSDEAEELKVGLSICLKISVSWTFPKRQKGFAHD